VLSLPPLGVTLLRRRVREATLQLVNELYEGSPELGRDGEYREDDEEDDEVDVRFVAPKVRGHVRFLAGEMLANRPWRLITTMKGTLAAAFATAPTRW